MESDNDRFGDVARSARWFRALYGRGFEFPNTYLSFDFETTGIDVGLDLILQVGFMVVKDGVVVSRPAAALLNWADNNRVKQQWLRERLALQSSEMAAKTCLPDPKYRGGLRTAKHNGLFTYDNLRASGVAPIAYLEGLANAFCDWQELGYSFVVHNGIGLDLPIFENHLRRYSDVSFRFDCNQVIDVGLFERASNITSFDLLPNKPTTMTHFYTRASEAKSRRQWNLTGHCVEKYRLAEKYDIDVARAHTADFDCYVAHLLYQEFRNFGLLQNRSS